MCSAGRRDACTTSDDSLPFDAHGAVGNRIAADGKHVSGAKCCCHIASPSPRRNVMWRFQWASSVCGKSSADVRPAGFLAAGSPPRSSAAPRRACSAIPSRWDRRTAAAARSGDQWSMLSRASCSPSASRRTPMLRHIRLCSELRMSARFSGSVERVDARVLDHRGGEIVVQLGGGPRRPFARMRAVDHRLQQAVRGQAVGPVQSAGGDFAGRPKPGQRRAALEVDA